MRLRKPPASITRPSGKAQQHIDNAGTIPSVGISNDYLKSFFFSSACWVTLLMRWWGDGAKPADPQSVFLGGNSLQRMARACSLLDVPLSSGNIVGLLLLRPASGLGSMQGRIRETRDFNNNR